jgi:hypothetical protein
MSEMLTEFRSYFFIIIINEWNVQRIVPIFYFSITATHLSVLLLDHTSNLTSNFLFLSSYFLHVCVWCCMWGTMLSVMCLLCYAQVYIAPASKQLRLNWVREERRKKTEKRERRTISSFFFFPSKSFVRIFNVYTKKTISIFLPPQQENSPKKMLTIRSTITRFHHENTFTLKGWINLMWVDGWFQEEKILRYRPKILCVHRVDLNENYELWNYTLWN